ncbi:MAG: ThuA domain-containing protein [Myxococcales bacterium]|nr:ThuA domain-containing protein [Myxococcales bacterium]
MADDSMTLTRLDPRTLLCVAATLASSSLLGCTGLIEGRRESMDAARDAVALDTHRESDAADAGPSLDASDDRAAPDDAPSTRDVAPPRERICEAWGAPTDMFDQSVVPIEVEPASASATKIVLVAGAASASHPRGAHQFFAVVAVLAKLLCRVSNVVPVVVRDGWPTDPRVFDGAASIVFYADGAASHPLDAASRRAALAPHIARGAGFVNLHYAVEYTAQSAPTARDWLGATYEPGFSVNPLWRAGYSSFPTHPIVNGVAAFEIEDEWYYNVRWRDDRSSVVELLRATPPDSTRTTPDTAANPGRAEVTAWAFVRPDGGRSFGFTGGHWFANWLDSADAPHASMQRRLVAQGILWSAGVAVPSAGVDVTYTPTDVERYLDRR